MEHLTFQVDNLQFDVFLDNNGGHFIVIMKLEFHFLIHDSNYIRFMYGVSIHLLWNIFWEE